MSPTATAGDRPGAAGAAAADAGARPAGGVGAAYQPALDGLRGAAVLGVIAFHLGHLRGGFLGVDLFFTLSGYLITSLLLAEGTDRGGVDLRRFWVRRGRRLLPALALLLGGVAVYAALWARPDELEGIRGPGLAALAYVTNWWFVIDGDGYWDLFVAPSPLEHLWSLAIEAQFYVVWPLVVLVVLRARRPRRALAVVAASLAVASTLLMASRATAGSDLAAAYLGTGSRAASILVGAVAAIALFRRTVPEVIARSLAALTVVGALVLAWLWATVDGAADLWLYRGGFLVHAIVVAVIIAAVSTRPAGAPARLLGWLPLRWVGKVSYGAYLWHWPVIVVVDASRTGLHGGSLLVLRLGITTVLTVASFVLVEEPIRRGALRGRGEAVLAVVTPVALAVALVVTTIPPATTLVIGPAPTVAEVAEETGDQAGGEAGDETGAGTEDDAAVGDGPGPEPVTSAGAPPATEADEPAVVGSAEGSSGRATEASAPGEEPDGPVDPATAAGDVPWLEGTSDLLRVRAAGPLPELGTPSADDPLDVLLVGDSYMFDAAPGIAAALEATGAVNAVQAGMFGFTITDDRGGDTLRGLVAEHRPDLVVTMWAAFDAAWLADHDADEYRRLLDAAMEDLTAGGTTVVVIGFAPSMTPGIDPEPVDRTINRFLADLPARFPGSVLYLDPDPVVAPSGEASRWLDTREGRLLVRKVDLGHFCGDGAARFGSAVGELVGRLTGAPAADPAAWWAGSWRAEPRYDDPPGACAA